jgi:hypothetical protein
MSPPVGYQVLEATGGGNFPPGTASNITQNARHTHTIYNATTGISVGGGGGANLNGQVGPGGTRPIDTGAYIVCSKIGKL